MNAVKSHTNNFNLIRLLAASQVVFVHIANHIGFTGPLVNAIKLFPGVPTFYFISGFLIYSSYDRLTPAGWRAFYINRFLRIYPALIVVTALSFFSVYATGYLDGKHLDPANVATFLIGQVTIVQFYNPSFMREFGTGVMNGALWTISVEVQFYLLVPLLYWLLHRRPKAWVALAAFSVIVNVVMREFSVWEKMAWKLLAVSFLPWVFMFLAGFWASSRPALLQRALRFNGWLALAAFVASMYLIGNVTTNSNNSINPVSVALLWVIGVRLAFADLGKFGELFRKNDLSYGTYLYHIPIINLLMYATTWSHPVQALVAVVATFACASASWFLIEKPSLGLKNVFARRLAPAAAAGGA